MLYLLPEEAKAMVINSYSSSLVKHTRMFVKQFNVFGRFMNFVGIECISFLFLHDQKTDGNIEKYLLC